LGLLNIIGKNLGKLLRIFTMLFLFSPIFFVFLYSITALPTDILPVHGVSFEWYLKFISRRAFIDGLKNSLFIAIIATTLAVIIGISSSYALSRYEFRGKSVIRAGLLSPITVPGVIIGLSLLLYFQSIGIKGGLGRLIAGHTLIITPYIIRVVLPSFYGIDRSVEESAMNLGANKIQTFWKITLPLIKPGVVAGSVIAFAMSFGNVSATVFLSSPGFTTLPVQILAWMMLESTPTVAAGSTLIMLLTYIVVILIERFIGLDNLVGGLRF
jgi:putative spermidine/putrescine transport system permease protein